ncbi:MAG: lytic transglycosylase domain-containing protein [Betaproteobacteria bacterium]
MKLKNFLYHLVKLPQCFGSKFFSRRNFNLLKNSSAVIGAFCFFAAMINPPLRAELASTLLPENLIKDVQNLAENYTSPSITKVSIDIGSNQFSEIELINMAILNKNTPSIAQVASQYNGKIDMSATNTPILDTIANQKVLAEHIVKKYRLDYVAATEYISHAVVVGKETNLDPVLLLAVMAVESGYNPKAQSPAGAQGLMQVITGFQTNLYAPYGGNSAAFRPEANIRIGAVVIRQLIAQTGSLQAALRYYVGGAYYNDGGYTSKVLREKSEFESKLNKNLVSFTPYTVISN